MAYQVIARKWRPKTFDELVGQNHISQSLKNAIETDRLPHALLFTGPRGTGKTSSARILARMLRSPDPKTEDEIREAQLISEGRSLDVIEIDGASNNGVDAVRDLREGVKYKPSSGHYKIYIIDEVHMLSTAAFNALLKTLEEPPEHAVFILATTEVHKIPQTILSRCQRFDFRRISTKEIVERLKLICDKDGIQAEENALWVIARQGDGSMRDSQSLLDQVITFAGGDLKLESVVAILGLTDRSLLVETLRSLVHRDKELMLNLIQRIFEAGYDPKLYAQDLLEELRHLLLVKLGIRGLDLPDAELDTLMELSQALPEEDIHFLFDMTLKGADDIPRSADPRIVLEMLLLRMVAAPKIQALAALLSSGGSEPASARVSGGGASQSPKPKASSTDRKTAPSSTPKPASAESSEPAPTAAEASNQPKPSPAQEATRDLSREAPATPPTDPQEKWGYFVRLVRDKNPIFAAKLTAFVVCEARPEGVTLGIPTTNRLLAAQLKEPAVQSQLQEFAKEIMGPSYKVEITEGSQLQGESILQQTERASQEETDAIRRQVSEHPLVRSAKSVFNGEIVEIKDTKN